MKIRIFALAKELGMDSKVLIDECNRAGVKLKNSALASITPEERDIVIEYLNKNKQPSDSPSADVEDQATLTPQREQTKLRTIKAMTSRSQPSRSVSQKSAPKVEETEERSSQEKGKSVIETDEVEEEPETAVVEEASSKSDQPEGAQARPGSVQRMAGGRRSPKEENGEGGDEALSRDDYVPAGGAAPSSTIREMKPRGSTRSGKQQSKAKSKSALPTVAAPPAYKQPVIPKVKKKEEKAQKPEVRLTADILEQKSPLAAHLAQHTEQKKRDKDRDPQDEDSKQRRGSISLVEARKQRREQRKEGRRGFAPDGTEQQETVGRRPRRTKRKQDSSNIVHKTEAEVELPITVRSLSEAMGRPAKAIMSIMFKEFGEMVTINQIIEEETALAVALELGVDLTFKRQKGIEETVNEIIEQEDAIEDLVTRPPIITVLGHVDHGKTTLVDSLRNSKVVEGEAGGITQHIAAYQVEHNDHKLTFVDTPGHAAFSEMRSRGANVTDMVVLVVAADDGVMPQTAESISHVKASGVPMVVAMNKIDLPEINEQKVLTDLAAQDVLPSEWGGETEVVRVSALNGTGLDNLLETLLLTAELHELKANPNRPAVGVCLEGFRDEGRGSVAWLIVQKGTLRIGDAVVCGKSYGYIRAMYDDRDQQLEEAPPSLPVKVTGLDSVPGAGDHFAVLSDIEQARELAEERRHEGRADSLARHSGGPRTLDDIMGSVREGEIQDLSLIIKADTPGSLEAIRSEISKFEHPEVRVKILHEGVGGVNESDVYLATASDAIIIAFHVIAEDRAKNLAIQEGVEIRRYSIIYEVVDDIRQSLEGLLRPELVQEQTGRALVLQTFSISRFGKIAGCRVLNGTINRNDRVHVIRDQKILNQYPIASLKREKDDTKEVREGMECGILLAGFNDIKEGDLLEAFRINEVKRTLDSTS
ncbi:translation initiation factor IF-2 [Gimesia aquarii]|uniref:Translation initiation factor IF-2 n=1 Tax=Gimesia aquarii TaxID=2527964 RepID=A0A517W1A0_9PLAN|nr:translation initiation factor IF-2 [Gimesia aquarii]QDT99034.1 Translation initiation factor IF-2 [Gimesia aquarii]